jgi:hypothetical protein
MWKIELLAIFSFRFDALRPALKLKVGRLSAFRNPGPIPISIRLAGNASFCGYQAEIMRLASWF